MIDAAQFLKELGTSVNGHAVFSPSGSGMWLNCSGSLIPNLLADNECSFEAAEGTVAHEMAELILTNGTAGPAFAVGQVVTVDGFDITVDYSMVDYVKGYVEYCQATPGDTFTEVRVDLSALTPIPDQGGTADHVACTNGKLVITDLKYGRGVYVEVVGNTQALLYAAGVFMEYDWEYDFQEIEMRIYQPRMDNIATWTVDRAYLLEFMEYVKARAKAAWEPDAPRTPGEKQCQWCRVKANCASFALYHENLSAGVFDSLDDDLECELSDNEAALKVRLTLAEYEMTFASGKTLTTAEMATLYKFRKQAENWWKAVEDELERRADQGEIIPGHKMVQGRTVRQFTSDARAMEHLEFLGVDELFTKKLKSPNGVETDLVALGFRRKDIPDLLKAVVTKRPGKPVLVNNTDKRPPIAAVFDNVFDDADDVFDDL